MWKLQPDNAHLYQRSTCKVINIHVCTVHELSIANNYTRYISIFYGTGQVPAALSLRSLKDLALAWNGLLPITSVQN